MNATGSRSQVSIPTPAEPQTGLMGATMGGRSKGVSLRWSKEAPTLLSDSKISPAICPQEAGFLLVGEKGGALSGDEVLGGCQKQGTTGP